MKTFAKTYFLILVVLVETQGRNIGIGEGGYGGNEYIQSEKCPDATCRSPPRGTWCEPNYNIKEDDGCCPEWKCSNGQTIYGIRRKTSNWNSWKTKWDTEWSSLSPGSGSGQWSNWIYNDNDLSFSKPRDPLFDRYVGKRR